MGDGWQKDEKPCPKCGGVVMVHLVSRMVGGTDESGELTWEDWDIDVIGIKCQNCGYNGEDQGPDPDGEEAPIPQNPGDREYEPDSIDSGENDDWGDRDED